MSYHGRLGLFLAIALVYLLILFLLTLLQIH